MNPPSFKDLSVATRQVATKSAMNPIQWICALTTPFCLAAACVAPPPLQYAFFVLACVPVIYGIRVFEHLMKNDPDRLQSEKYLIEKQVIATMGIAGENGEQIILPPGPRMDNPLLELPGEENA
jgi:hypothetical protein